MSLDYRIAPLPAVWPGTTTPSYQRRRAPFKTIETKALALLEREIKMLGGTNVEIAVDVEPHQVRRDGMLYANARPKSPAVIVSFDTKQGRLAFPCDRFGFFWANVDAIARALDDLRRVDRYGVQQGRQYTGFKAIPATTAPTLTAEQAAAELANRTHHSAALLLDDADAFLRAYRLARARAHPDVAGGSHDGWHVVELAGKTLAAHHGVTL